MYIMYICIHMYTVYDKYVCIIVSCISVIIHVSSTISLSQERPSLGQSIFHSCLEFGVFAEAC